MSKPVYVNENEIYEKYRARLLDYKVGAASISNSYLSHTNSVIPVKLKESVGTRIIELYLEFEGVSCNESLISISNMTADLLKETEIQLPDGFYYFCVLDEVSSPILEGDTFYSVTFRLVGYRHLAMQSQTFTKSGSINVIGNCASPAIITINDASEEVTVNDITVSNITDTIVINGYDKTVMTVTDSSKKNKFKDCNLTKFPMLNPGVNIITISGTATVKVEYKPIYL